MWIQFFLSRGYVGHAKTYLAHLLALECLCKCCFYFFAYINFHALYLLDKVVAKKRESLQTHGNLNGIYFLKLSGKQQHVRNVIENQISTYTCNFEK